MRFKAFLILFVIITQTLSTVQGQVSNKEESPFQFSASYIGDLVSNFSGGIKRGTAYLGLANLKAGFDTEKASWWKDGELFVNLGNTHGGKPSADLIGDFQGVSNIEAGNLTFMYELWYRQHVANLTFTVGLQDLNADFAMTRNGSLFTNSSFGIQSSIADNNPVPIFPLTALGANLKWSITDSYTLQMAVFDGTPDDFESNPYNTNWTLNKSQGYLAVGEFQLIKSLLKGRSGVYKFGVYFHEHNDSIDVEQENGGIYVIGDQELTDKLSVFSQIGFSPKSKNNHNHFFSLGFNYKSPFRKRPHDLFGMAVAYAGIDRNVIGSETALELTYSYEVCKNIYVRPDIQYIINPAGTGEKLKNALVGFLRFGVEF
jgi:porin